MLNDLTIIIDNFDSFTWNFVNLLKGMGRTVQVIRNDAMDASAVLRLNPSRILLSPGPGRPEDGDLMDQLLTEAPWDLPILGVCLGHQAIGVHFGVPLVRAPRPVHGQVSMIHHDSEGLFNRMPESFTATRYHSLLLQESDLSEELRATAWVRSDGQDLLMAIEHRDRPLAGVQFHPESFLTDGGVVFMENFLKWVSPVLS